LTIAAEYKDGILHVTATKISGENACDVMEFQPYAAFSALEAAIKNAVDPTNTYNVVLVIGTCSKRWNTEPLSKVFMQEIARAAEDSLHSNLQQGAPGSSFLLPFQRCAMSMRC